MAFSERFFGGRETVQPDAFLEPFPDPLQQRESLGANFRLPIIILEQRESLGAKFRLPIIIRVWYRGYSTIWQGINSVPDSQARSWFVSVSILLLGHYSSHIFQSVVFFWLRNFQILMSNYSRIMTSSLHIRRKGGGKIFQVKSLFSFARIVEVSRNWPNLNHAING